MPARKTADVIEFPAPKRRSVAPIAPTTLYAIFEKPFCQLPDFSGARRLILERRERRRRFAAKVGYACMAWAIFAAIYFLIQIARAFFSGHFA